MSATFTYHAAEAVQLFAKGPGDSAELQKLFKVLDSASSLQDVIARYPSTILLGQREGGDVFVVPAGAVRVLAVHNPDPPGGMVVVSVFGAGEDHSGPSTFNIRHEPRPN